jgi:hypothetical protein
MLPARAVTAVALAAGMAAVLLGRGVALAQTLNPGASSPAQEQVVLSGSVNVLSGTTVGEVVVFHGRAVVSGSVRGDVVVLDGSITVNGGHIAGNVVTLHGPIHVTGTSLIGGDVLGGGHVVVDAGAKIRGQVRQHVGFTLQGPLAALGILLGSVALAVSVLMLGLFLLLISPRGADHVAAAATSAPLASMGWGLVVVIGLPVVCVATIATIVGLPLGLAALLGFALLFLVGLVWTAWTIGRAILPSPRSRPLALVVGWAIVAVVGLVPFLNLALWGLGAAFGLGAMTVAVWRSRRTTRSGRHRARGGGFLPEPPITLPAAAPAEPVASEEPVSYPATSDD